MPVAEDHELLTLKEANELMKVPIPTLRYWLARGELVTYKRGDGRVMVDVGELRARVQRQKSIERAD